MLVNKHIENYKVKQGDNMAFKLVIVLGFKGMGTDREGVHRDFQRPWCYQHPISEELSKINIKLNE